MAKEACKFTGYTKYRFERADAEPDIEALKEAGAKFWKCVQDGTIPPMPLPMRY